MSARMLDLPGFEGILDKVVIESPIILLKGPAGAGKTLYCRQFLLDGLKADSRGILVSSEMNEKQFRSLFSDLPTALFERIQFIPMLERISESKKNWRALFVDEESAVDKNHATNDDQVSTHSKQLLLLLEEIQGFLESHNTDKRDTRVVFDSLSYLQSFFDERTIQKFVTALSVMLREEGATGFLVLSTASGSKDGQAELVNSLTSMLDIVLETKIEDNLRSIRLASIRGQSSDPSWIRYRIEETGQITFENQETLQCALCGKSIKGKPLQHMENVFDSSSCVDTYRKLSQIYGSGISPSSGIPADAVNLHFFFVDIVGLSDPSLSVKRQMDKISALNNLVRACQAFKNVPKDKKIVLPTGDGMAIGYLINAELPFQLGIQLHKQLRLYNELKKPEDRLGVRIGLSSGHVFIHNDINENQNVWGPGIILARRVMDLGDNLHILIEGDMAKGLVALKDEYRKCISELCEYKIKHGQSIKIFSAFSSEFGNSEVPAKLRTDSGTRTTN